MFEVGKRYQFRIIEGGDEGTFSGVVEAYNHPLVMLASHKISPKFAPGLAPGETERRDTIPGKIINVTSVHFISAEAQ